MQSNTQKTFSLQECEQGVLQVHSFFDAHPVAPFGLTLVVIALIYLNFRWKKEEKP